MSSTLDVSANSNFTFYVCADQAACSANLYGGTSFATPMWAGYLALANEQYLSNGATSTLGFINPALYTIGLSSNYDTDFHDITSGGNTDGSTVGYDLSTGWGSPNGNNLVNALAPVTASFTLAAAPKGLSLAPGKLGSSKITATPTGGFNSTISLSAKGQPTGVTVVFKPSSIAGGAGSSTMNIKVGTSTKAGTYKITVTGTGGSVTATTTVTLKVT